MQLGGRSSLNEVRDFTDVMVGGCSSSTIVLKLERFPRLPVVQPTLVVDVTKPGVVELGDIETTVVIIKYSLII